MERIKVWNLALSTVRPGMDRAMKTSRHPLVTRQPIATREEQRGS